MIPITPYARAELLGEHQDKVVELYKADAALNETIPESIRESTEWLLRMVNCYYSNKIEGNPTHPKEFLQTQDKKESAYKEKSDWLLELLAHLEIQSRLAARLESPSKVVSEDFIKFLHRSFYFDLPDSFLAIKDRDGNPAIDSDGKQIFLVPGEYRTRDVCVGRHVPPSHVDLPGYMRWIERSFDAEPMYGITPVFAAAGLHHRLAWVHPFQDGNGRAIRLLTDCYMRGAGFGGYGLWSITRGFGKDTKSYYAALAKADIKNDRDGKGILSESGLVEFTKYFIDTALDQVKFFTALLEPKKLGIRVDYYFELRAKGGLPDHSGDELPILKITARDIYRLLLEKGSMSRSAIAQHLGKSEQTLRPTIRQMDDEGLISAKAKHDVKLKLSAGSVEFLFPQIW